ncbi:hypothetical protein BJV78DRAFT_393460 [Lactifluus subvellereus]|nr:hypothetical protein BJV78DRAFT_393460 [Lactifluus subvellereus]
MPAQLQELSSIGSSFASAFTEAGAQVTVTPYYLAPPEVTQRDPGSWMTGPQPQSGPLEATTAPDTHSSSSHSLLLPPPVMPAPVGLSSKELAQLRTDALVHSQNNHTRSGSSGSRRDPSPSVTTLQRAATTATPSNTRRLESEVEDLRREMQLLHIYPLFSCVATNVVYSCPVGLFRMDARISRISNAPSRARKLDLEINQDAGIHLRSESARRLQELHE